MVNDVAITAQVWMLEYMTAKLQERRDKPEDDLFSDLVQAEIPDGDGGTRRLSNAEAAAFGNLLVSAGTETVARLLGWAAVVLDAHPGPRAELAADSALLPGALEELLRFEAPSPVQGRFTARAVEMHGDPDSFDIHRERNRERYSSRRLTTPVGPRQPR